VKRLIRYFCKIVSSPALPPVIFGIFLIIYIGIAFLSEETLTVLMAITRRNFILVALLALLPLNCLSRIVVEVWRYRKMRRALSDAASVLQPSLYDETVDQKTPSAFPDLEVRLRSAGYRTIRSANHLSAWRGISLSPSRIIFLAGMFCLFSGILVSLETRTVYRQPVIEGESFQSPSGNGGIVQRIIFGKSSGPILSKDLLIEVAATGSRGGVDKFGVYPPSSFRGYFVYPRYLGIAILYRFSAPDLPVAYEKLEVLPLYPPGREASMEISGSPYRVILSLVKPDDGSDPYITGRMDFLFKLLKGSDVLYSGSMPGGGVFTQNGFRLQFTDCRRMVITDFIADYGVLLIWVASAFLVIAFSAWLPVRCFSPRREMIFRSEDDMVHAFSRAEGGARKHAGAFHEALDLLELKKNVKRSDDDGASVK
jgi:hypothetical protein